MKKKIMNFSEKRITVATKRFKKHKFKQYMTRTNVYSYIDTDKYFVNNIIHDSGIYCKLFPHHIEWCSLCMSYNSIITRWFIKNKILAKFYIIDCPDIFNNILKWAGTNSIKWYD